MIFGAASEAFSQKNINCSIAESVERFREVARAVGADGIEWDRIDAKCGPLLENLRKAGSDDDRRSASLALNYIVTVTAAP